MASKKAPLSGRELIRYLPDLLTGKEPVFDDPAVQRFITQDPEGRAAVGLIADTAAALTVAHDRVATQTYAAIKPLRESVLAAKKYAKRQLADLLFYEGMRRHQAGLREDQVEVFTEAADLSIVDLGRCDCDANELIAQLGLPQSTVDSVQLLLQPTDDARRVNPIEAASDLFAADVALVPGRDGSIVMREIATENCGQGRSARHWEAIAAALDAPIARAAAIDRAAQRHCAAGSSGRATALSKELSELAPNSFAFQAHVLLISLVTGNSRLIHIAADRVAAGAHAYPAAWPKALECFKADIRRLTRSLSKQDMLDCRARINSLDSTLRSLSEGLRT